MLAQSFLSNTQIQMIETKFTTLFCMCGYNRNTSYKIQYALTMLGDVGFMPLCASAGSGYILHLLKNWRTLKRSEPWLHGHNIKQERHTQFFSGQIQLWTIQMVDFFLRRKGIWKKSKAKSNLPLYTYINCFGIII